MSPFNGLGAFLRSKKPKLPTPQSTTPNADYKLRMPYWLPFAKIGAVIGVPLILLSLCGQPALRMQYTWNGNGLFPVYFKCDYLTLFDGWRHIENRGGTYCPVIGLFPLDLSKLLFS
ncbi:amino acid transporter [Roseibium sp. TrichSKD4]|uniref:amino acid transporter n=1 Tax=Roseibium sp. TrichSKD4 TaxID=744980 RepID=UPI0001E56577|nr:amino acid transporter [Roseibium sp. TrichSKD4]EFO34080.1 amino acid transporter [Roseibium sp. TrichSKD4]